MYIPDDTRKIINLIAKAKSKAEAEVIRDALNQGLKVIHPQTTSAQALLNFVKEAETIPTHGKIPADLIENIDYYTWGGKKGE